MDIIFRILTALGICKWVLHTRPQSVVMNVVRQIGVNVWAMMLDFPRWMRGEVPAVVIQPTACLFTLTREWTDVQIDVLREVTAVSDHLFSRTFRPGDPLFLEVEWEFHIWDGRRGEYIGVIPMNESSEDMTEVFPTTVLEIDHPLPKELEVFLGS